MEFFFYHASRITKIVCGITKESFLTCISFFHSYCSRSCLYLFAEPKSPIVTLFYNQVFFIMNYFTSNISVIWMHFMLPPPPDKIIKLKLKWKKCVKECDPGRSSWLFLPLNLKIRKIQCLYHKLHNVQKTKNICDDYERRYLSTTWH